MLPETFNPKKVPSPFFIPVVLRLILSFPPPTRMEDEIFLAFSSYSILSPKERSYTLSRRVPSRGIFDCTDSVVPYL